MKETESKPFVTRKMIHKLQDTYVEARTHSDSAKTTQDLHMLHNIVENLVQLIQLANEIVASGITVTAPLRDDTKTQLLAMTVSVCSRRLQTIRGRPQT